MNRELPVYFLAALLIHGLVLWAWARTPATFIGGQETPAVEIEFSEEQKTPAPVDAAKDVTPHEAPPLPPEKVTAQPIQHEPEPEPEPEPLETPVVKPTPQATTQQPRAVAPKPIASRPPAASHSRSADAPSAARAPTSSGKDRSHASWKHRVTPTYPPSALMARKSGRVLVTVQVNALGQATAASLTASSGNPVLDAAAVRAARESTYNPKCILGVPLPDTVTIPYNFDIRNR